MANSPGLQVDSKSIDLIKVNEFGVSLTVNKDSLSPKRNEGYYCQEMDINRAFVTTALSVYCTSGNSVFTPVKCIDVVGSSGAAGLQWKKYLGDLVNVHINDPHENSNRIIAKNSQDNNLTVEILQRDPRVLLQETPFSFIHLDCHTDAAIYLDSLMRNAPKQGLLAITTKDDGALYGRTPEMAVRNYGGVITRTFYAKELAARLIIAGLARSAAIHSKGLEILCVLNVKSTITIIAKILKGPAQANACISKLSRMVHCSMCEDRAFYASSLYPVENPGKLLSCQCSEQTPGKVIMDLGPVWAGRLFDFHFLLSMTSHLNKFPWKSNLSELMETLLTEAWCPKVEDNKVLHSLLKSESDANGKQKDYQPKQQEDLLGPPCKKIKEDLSVDKITVPFNAEPPFYFNLHKHSPKGPKMVRAVKIVSALQQSGFRASRTHFDPLAVRTNASLAVLKKVIANSLK